MAARKAKAEQLEVPGTERVRNPAIEAAANELRAERTARMDSQKREAELQDKLVDVMREAGETIYKFEGDEDELIVTLDEKTKVKIRKAGSPVRSEDE